MNDGTAEAETIGEAVARAAREPVANRNWEQEREATGATTERRTHWRTLVVVDASTLVAAVAATGSIGDRARAMLQGKRRAAPHLIDAEVANALRSMVRRGELTDAVGAAARLMAERLVHRRHPFHGAIAARAWQLRHNLSFYDALYIALAENLHCLLITADSRIARAFKGHDLISTITPAD